MFQQLQRKMQRRRYLRALIPLAMSVLLFVLFAPGLALLARGPVDLYALDAGSLEGSYVAARVDIIYQWYAEAVRDSGTENEQTIRREYVIPAGRDGYMGMVVPARQLPQAEAVLRSTQAVRQGQAEALDGSQVIVTGTVYRMDRQTQQFFGDVVGLDSLSPADQARFYPLVLVPGRVGRYTDTALFLGLAAILALLALGAGLLVRAVLCTGPQQPEAYLDAAAGDSADLLSGELDEFYRDTPPLGHLRANCRWVLCENDADSWLLYNRDIAWVYRSRRGARYGLVVCARSPQGRRLRARYIIPARSAAESLLLQERLRPLLPGAVFGYNPLWEPLYRASPSRFCRDILAEQQAAREAAARRAARSGSLAGPSANGPGTAQ